MARAKYQVLVLPYKRKDGKILYCIFKRSDMDAWQFIAGGGEDADASPLVSAKREAYEEAHIPPDEKPEYCFAVEIINADIKISNEHTGFEWVDYQTAMQRLKYDSNKTALWELDNKIHLGIMPETRARRERGAERGVDRA